MNLYHTRVPSKVTSAASLPSVRTFHTCARSSAHVGAQRHRPPARLRFGVFRVGGEETRGVGPSSER
eukprot:2617387-Rhodomonas_salina.1